MASANNKRLGIFALNRILKRHRDMMDAARGKCSGPEVSICELTPRLLAADSGRVTDHPEVMHFDQTRYS